MDVNLDRIKEFISKAPNLPGVYFFINFDNEIIYIGKSKDIKQRLLQHYNQSKELLKNTYKIEYKVLNSELEALITEAILINKYKPFYNIKFKYEKPLKYIVLINKDGYPYFDIGEPYKDNVELSIGPFLNIYKFEILKKLLGNLFGIRLCKYNFKKNKPNLCMYYYTNHCSGICQEKISHKEYLNNINLAVKFLKTDTQFLKTYLNQLYDNLEKLKENLEYEKAIIIRDKIKTIEKYISNYLETSEIYYMYFSDLYSDSIFVVIANIYLNDLAQIPKNTQIIELNNIKDLSQEQILLNVILEYIPNTNIPKEIKTNWYNLNIEKLIKNIKNMDFSNLCKFEDLNNDSVITKLSKINLSSINDSETINYLDKLLKVYYLKSQKLSKERIIKELSKVLKIKSINRIEVIDVSHFYGENVYGALIVFEKNTLKKDKYRIFKLHNSFDDLANIKELLSRRLKYLINPTLYKDKSLNSFPQIILIDGGKNQLISAYNVLFDYKDLLNSIKLMSIVKPEDKILLLKINENSFSIDELKDLDRDVWNFLKMLRDEAHRYANSKRLKYSSYITDL